MFETRIGGSVPVSVRRWQGLGGLIMQDALDHHFVSVHLGGPKRLVRRGEGASRSRAVPCGAYSIVPAGAAFHWDTEGPVDFIHLYFDPAMVRHVVCEAFDRDPAQVSIEDALGENDKLIRLLLRSFVAEMGGTDRQQAYLDDILQLLLCGLLRLHSNARTSAMPARHALAPFRLRRAKDFVEENLERSIGVADIAEAAGISQYHFSRAFRQATGQAPYAYLLERRIVAARRLLIEKPMALTTIAAQCGFSSLSQFSRMFKREFGVSPSHYRERY